MFFQTMVPLNTETFHEVPVSRAVQLSRGDSVRTALLVELDVSVSVTESLVIMIRRKHKS